MGVGVQLDKVKCENYTSARTAQFKIGPRKDSLSHLCLAFIEIICFDDIFDDVTVGMHMRSAEYLIGCFCLKIFTT